MYLLATANGTQVSLQNVDSKFVMRSVLPPNTATGCAFSPDGTLLAVAHYSSPHITIYNTSTWAKLADPSVLPPNAATGCACAWPSPHHKRAVRPMAPACARPCMPSAPCLQT